MSAIEVTKDGRKRLRASLVGMSLCAGVLLPAMTAALAQEGPRPPAPAAQAPADNPDFFTKIGRWFDQQLSSFNSNIKDAKAQIDNFGHEAGIAAKTSADAAKDAADVLARIPKTRVVKIHEKCALAPNGAPDCATVALNVCKAQGYVSGKSLDMTTAEKCPARVWASGRPAAPGECTTETFVSRVLCN